MQCPFEQVKAQTKPNVACATLIGSVRTCFLVIQLSLKFTDLCKLLREPKDDAKMSKLTREVRAVARHSFSLECTRFHPQFDATIESSSVTTQKVRFGDA